MIVLPWIVSLMLFLMLSIAVRMIHCWYVVAMRYKDLADKWESIAEKKDRIREIERSTAFYYASKSQRN